MKPFTKTGPISDIARHRRQSSRQNQAGRACAGWQWIFLSCLLAACSACTETVDLQTALNDRDAMEIASVLNDNGIDAHQHETRQGVTLTVRRDDLARASEVMQSAALPRQSSPDLGRLANAYLLLKPTAGLERARYMNDLAQELEHALGRIEHVVVARVQLLLPDRIEPCDAFRVARMTVLLKYRSPADEAQMTPLIREAVASRLPELSGEQGFENMSVMLAAAEATEQAEPLIVGEQGRRERIEAPVPPRYPRLSLAAERVEWPDLVCS